MSILAKTSSALNTDGASTPVDQYDHEITLVDHTRPDEEPLSPQETAGEPQTPLSVTSSVDPLRHLWTREGLQRELQRRKYARYQEDRVLPQDRPAAQKRPTLNTDENRPSGQRSTSTSDSPQISQDVEEASPLSPRKRDTIRHHKNKVKDAVKDTVRGSRLKHTHTDAESLFDVLYENQRGAFFCGIPRFSSNSLLNFDPPAWQTQTFHPSPVDITNAQVPDPSWVWATGWNNWYVDMNFGVNEPIGAKKADRPAVRARGDTDEEGWRYSFAFGQRGRWAWHGTHPWFHSFVRRRRWVRLRVKRGHALAPEGARVKVKAENEGHMLNAEYFTIHNSKRPASRYTEGTDASERPEYKRYSAATSKRWSRQEGDMEEASVEIRDMPSLLKALRKAAVDREKIAAVRQFLDQGGDELHYLADNIHEIMSLLIFQASRQQLQSILSGRLREAEKEQSRNKHKEKATSSVDGPEDGQSVYVDNLRRATEAARDECQHLEYWSSQHSIKGTKENGTAHDDSDDCDEKEEDNEAPIGETTIFNDDVDDGKPDTLDVDGVKDSQSSSAPDRPAEIDEDQGGRRNPEDDWAESSQASLPGPEPMPIPGEAGLGDDSEDAPEDGLSSSPELVRFETAHEEPEGDEEEEAEETTNGNDARQDTQ